MIMCNFYSSLLSVTIKPILGKEFEVHEGHGIYVKSTNGGARGGTNS